MQSLSWNGQLSSSSIKLSCSKIVLNRSIKMGSHWNRKLEALSLPDLREMLWPRINKFASRLVNWTQQLYDNWLKCITSMYAGVCDGLPVYVTDFRWSTSSAAEPASQAAAVMNGSANRHTVVRSQTSGLPPCQKKREKTVGLLPVLLTKTL